MSRDSQKPRQKTFLSGTILAVLLLVVLATWYFAFFRSFKSRIAITNPLSNQAPSSGAFQKTAQPSTREGQDKLSQTVAANGDYASSVRQDNLLGQVVDIDRSGGVVDNLSYRVRLTIKIGDMGDANYYFNDSDLALLKLFKLVDGKEQPMTLTELRQGDRVAVDTKSDLLKGAESNLLEFKITKM